MASHSDYQHYEIKDREVRLKFMAQFILDVFGQFTQEDYKAFKEEFDLFLSAYSTQDVKGHDLIPFLPTLEDWLVYGCSSFTNPSEVFKERLSNLLKISVSSLTTEMRRGTKQPREPRKSPSRSVWK
jgi:hypothetical protein